MRVIHLLRKFDLAEWGGTESAVQRLFDGLRDNGVSPVMYCPQVNSRAPDGAGEQGATSPGKAGCRDEIRRFKACVPVWGISVQKRRQQIALGGNLMSFDLLPTMWGEPDVELVHTHTLGRLGGIASAVARGRRLPFVVSIHGGLLDLPPALKTELNEPAHSGFEWGKIFGLLLQSRRLIQHADAVLTCNPSEAGLLRERHPGKRIEVQPHGIPLSLYQQDHRAAAREAFPQIEERDVLLCIGRIDPVKNQSWLVKELPEILKGHPDALLVLAGACTNPAYGQSLERQISDLGLADHVLLTGGLPSGDPRLIGLMQEACVILLPSTSETFGIVLLEAWAAGTTVISSRTSGASALVQHGHNGWLFDLSDSAAFHDAINETLLNPKRRAQMAEAGHELVAREYDAPSVARKVKHLYDELIEEKHALRHSA